MSVEPFRRPTENAQSEPTDPRVEQTSALIRTLFSSLPLEEQERLLDEIIQKLRPIPAPRAGEVLGTIVRLLPKRPNWTVAELKQHIDEHGVAASPKEIYNAIGYLTRKGRVKRVGYGRYVVDGVEVQTLDDFGGPGSRNEFEGR